MIRCCDLSHVEWRMLQHHFYVFASVSGLLHAPQPVLFIIYSVFIWLMAGHLDIIFCEVSFRFGLDWPSSTHSSPFLPNRACFWSAPCPQLVLFITTCDCIGVVAGVWLFFSHNVVLHVIGIDCCSLFFLTNRAHF
jgi:hypothetical protein